MKITVNKIKSEAALLTIRQAVLDSGNKWVASNSTIVEADGKEWVSFGGFNGNPMDLWLRKKGTQGATLKTFIRISISDFTSILQELTYLKIEASDELKGLAQKEKEEKDVKILQSGEIVASFKDFEKAKKWMSNNEGNSHTRKTRWGNRAIKIGATRGFGNALRDQCELLLINSK